MISVPLQPPWAGYTVRASAYCRYLSSLPEFRAALGELFRSIDEQGFLATHGHNAGWPQEGWSSAWTEENARARKELDEAYPHLADMRKQRGEPDPADINRLPWIADSLTLLHLLQDFAERWFLPADMDHDIWIAYSAWTTDRSKVPWLNLSFLVGERLGHSTITPPTFDPFEYHPMLQKRRYDDRDDESRLNHRQWLSKRVEEMVQEFRRSIYEQAEVIEARARVDGFTDTPARYMGDKAAALLEQGARVLYRAAVLRLPWSHIAKMEVQDRGPHVGHLSWRTVQSTAHDWAAVLGMTLPERKRGRQITNTEFPAPI